MPSAARGAVPDADRPAYKYDLVEKEKVAIRFGVSPSPCVVSGSRRRLTIESDAVHTHKQLQLSDEAAHYRAFKGEGGYHPWPLGDARRAGGQRARSGSFP